MKKLTLESFIDQRKPFSHILYILFATAAMFIFSLWNGNKLPVSQKLTFLLLGLVQLEVFIFVARQIFKKVNTSLTGKELTKMVLSRFFLFLTICFIAALIIILLFEYSISLIKRDDLSMVLSNFMHFEFSSWFKATIGGLSFGAVVFIIIQWQEALKREQKLREENLVFQNETLKSQVNPHFLFNSLNTVSSLIQSDPEKAEQFINNLSSVYRYILENGQKDKVPVQSELDLLNRYFDLHRVRDEEKIALSIDYSGAENYQILPVSLQILLENAIKHNIATRENPLKISVYFEDQYIVVKNNLQKKATQLKSTGIGLRNLAERIRLVLGKALIIEENDNFFIAKIPLLK
jgi:two-component system, LytTR family, sensor kinase